MLYTYVGYSSFSEGHFIETNTVRDRGLKKGCNSNSIA